MLNVVATPIGNLSDISYRQAKVLMSSDIILAEDTRTAQNLLERAREVLMKILSRDIDHEPKIVSYYKDIEMKKLPLILKWLGEEKNISLISEAGMPLISDPGYVLIKACIHEKIPFTVVPGPSAVTTALIYAGFKSDSFMFLGFLPKKSSKLQKLLNNIDIIQQTMPESVFVAFESPQRIHKTLEVLAVSLPNHQLVITRELTKKYEQIYRGTAKELQKEEIKGEITLIIGPAT